MEIPFFTHVRNEFPQFGGRFSFFFFLQFRRTAKPAFPGDPQNARAEYSREEDPGPDATRRRWKIKPESTERYSEKTRRKLLEMPEQITRIEYGMEGGSEKRLRREGKVQGWWGNKTKEQSFTCSDPRVFCSPENGRALTSATLLTKPRLYRLRPSHAWTIFKPPAMYVM